MLQDSPPTESHQTEYRKGNSTEGHASKKHENYFEAIQMQRFEPSQDIVFLKIVQDSARFK